MTKELDTRLNNLNYKLNNLRILIKRLNKEMNINFFSTSSDRIRQLSNMIGANGNLYSQSNELSYIFREYLADDILYIMLKIIEKEYNISEPLKVLIEDINHAIPKNPEPERKRILNKCKTINDYNTFKAYLITKINGIHPFVTRPFDSMVCWSKTKSGHAYYLRLNNIYMDLINNKLK